MRRFSIIIAVAASFTSTVSAAPYGERQCHVDGFETPVRCISLTVPLDYAAPKGETIAISVAIAPATTARPKPDPLFVFAGGPGQAATGMGPWLTSAFAPARRERDIVLFDIRGTGLSTPIDCPFTLTSEKNGGEALADDAAACATKAGSKTSFLSSTEIVQDIERMRAALGYSKINLWGGSFGTRVSQHYARRYPAHVRAAVLDAATPVDSSIFETAPRYGQQALERLFRDCAEDKACATTFPDLKDAFARILDRAASNPALLNAIDPRSGKPSKTLIDRDAVAGIVRGALYSGHYRAVLPFAITQADTGNFSPLLALGTSTSEWSAETMSLATMLGVICPEDYSRARNAATSTGFMQDSYIRTFSAACSNWPHKPIPRIMLEAFNTNIPALVISGAADPVTPTASGAATLRMFASSVHVVIPNGFHTNSGSKCIADLIGEFLKDPNKGARDHACVAKITKSRFMLSPTL